MESIVLACRDVVNTSYCTHLVPPLAVVILMDENSYCGDKHFADSLPPLTNILCLLITVAEKDTAAAAQGRPKAAVGRQRAAHRLRLAAAAQPRPPKL